MCGRFALEDNGEVVAQQFELPAISNLAPRYNIAPTQPVAGIRLNAHGQRELTHFHWGLIPSWAKDTKMSSRMINARAETIMEKPAYRRAFKYRRCLVPVSGFYEWQKVGSKKQPMYIHHVAGELLAIAGIFEHWQSPDGSEIESVSLLTTAPNDLMASIHNRMPVIIEPTDYSTWLDTTVQQEATLQHLLRSFPSDQMTSYPVSTLVNNPRNELSDCIRPVA